MTTVATASIRGAAGAPPAGLMFAAPLHSFSAVNSEGSLLSQLLVDAFDSFDRDRDTAWASLSRAVALVRSAPPASSTRTSIAQIGALAPWQAKKAVAHIEANLEATVRIDDLAALARLSRSYFSRAFKATFGRSPQQFIQERRIALAQDLLLRNDEPICGIALICGFSDQPHLSRIFRRLVGASPSAWRRAAIGSAMAPRLLLRAA